MKLMKAVRATYVLLIICLIAGLLAVSEKTYAKSDIANCNVKLAFTLATYTDTYKRPKATVTYKNRTLKSGRDYKVTYVNNKYPGTACVVINGIGKYGKTKIAYFKIRVDSIGGYKAYYDGTVPPGKKSTINLIWEESKYCDYYKITLTRDGEKYGTYRTTKGKYSIKGTSKVGEYSAKIVAVAGPKKNISASKTRTVTISQGLMTPIASAKSPGYQRIDLSWDKITGAAGYYIYEYNKSTGATTTTTVTNPDTTSQSFQREKGTVCQYTVQAYSTVEGKTYKSDKSSVTETTSVIARIGQATQDENRNVRGGTKGDQTGREVGITNYSYSSTSGKYNHWQYIARFKDPAKAEKAAAAMEAACANDRIGYDQSSRSELYGYAKTANWDLSKITTSCECSCSPLVSVCINSTGIVVPSNWSTADSSMKAAIVKTGAFTIYTDSKYTTTDINLQRGDILVTPSRHAAMVL